MKSPSSAISAEDGASPKASLLEVKKTESFPIENGWHGHEFMKNGKPRPSAFRDYPEGIVPLHSKLIDALSPEEKNQNPTSPTISKGKVELKQAEEKLSALATEEGAKMNAESMTEEGAKRNRESDDRLVPEDQKAEKALIDTPKRSKTIKGEKKEIENASLKSSKLVEKRTSVKPDASKQEGEGKQIKAKVTPSEIPPKKQAKSGKTLEKNGPALDKPQDAAEARSSKKVAALESETQKVVTSSLIEKKKNVTASLASPSQDEEARANVEESIPEKMQKKPLDQEKSLEKETSSASAAVQETEHMGPNIPGGQTEAMDVEKRKEEEATGIEQPEEAEVVEKVGQPSKKSQPVKRKSGIRDRPDSLTQAKKVAKEGVGQENLGQELEKEVPPSKDAGTVKAKAVTDNAKPSGNEKRKRLLEEPNSSGKSKKMPKLKPTNEVQSPAEVKKAHTPAKAKEKEPNSKSQTPKSSKKPSTPSESSKKVKRSAGKSVKPATSTTDVTNARKLVLESLRLYDAVRRKLVQDEEKNGKQGRGSRSDLQAATLLKDENASRGIDKGYGPLPGVFVGDIFLFRTELSFARVHGPIQGGIAYLPSKESEFNTAVAISIISNVGQDGEDNGEELVYTGQGGRSADNKQIADQKLERGNLAMDGSRKLNTPVRILRGMKDVNSPTGKVYVYDGLYDVLDTYTAKGSGGFDEFKFRLQRRADQAELGSDVLKLAAELKSQSPSSRKDVVIADISKGKENQTICVVNTVDDDKGPADFEYATKVIHVKDLAKPESSDGCKCSGVCTASSSCSCFTRNGDELPYLNGGYLVREKDFIYECGGNCSCSSSCRNKSPEKGLKFRLEVFKTTNRGWGVRSLELIPAGSFICEYIGEVVADAQDAKEISNRQHMLRTRWLPETTPRWGDVPDIIRDRPSSTTRPDAGKPEIIIDASQVGNVARFFNHSCSPNLLVQKVLSGHQDVRYPHFKLFAIDNIPPLRELTFDYGLPPDQELATEQLLCLCGSLDCRGKLYV